MEMVLFLDQANKDNFYNVQSNIADTFFSIHKIKRPSFQDYWF